MLPLDEQSIESDPAVIELAASLAEEHPPVSIRCAFPQQQRFVEDDSRLQAVFCTRRAAKSYSAGLKAFRVGLKYPKCSVLIAGLSRLEIKRIFWRPILKDIAEKHALQCTFNETELTCTLPNGSVIYLLGMDANEKEKRKALGQKFPLVIIDEAQDFVTDLRALVWDVLRPTTSDYAGAICLLGTPGLLAKGMFYEVTKGIEPGWVLHEWTTYDNVAPSPDDPKLTCAQRWHADIEDLKAKRPGVEKTPSFRRQYMREWVIDETGLVYRYLTGRNDFAALPVYSRGDWHYLLACDMGHTDAASFQVGAFHDHDPNLYVLSAYKKPGMDLTDMANHAKALDRVYNFEAWVIDGANKQGVEEMRKRHGCPWRPADKTAKADFIELMNADFICGTIRLGPDCDPLRREYEGLIWDPKKLEAGKQEEHPACENHCADGGLYLWRYAFPYLSERIVDPPPAGSAEDLQEQEDAHEAAAEAHAARQAAEEDPLLEYAQ